MSRPTRIEKMYKQKKKMTAYATRFFYIMIEFSTFFYTSAFYLSTSLYVDILPVDILSIDIFFVDVLLSTFLLVDILFSTFVYLISRSFIWLGKIINLELNVNFE
jgi:hypothetical protein